MGNALKWFPDRRGLAAGLTLRGSAWGQRSPSSPFRNYQVRGYQTAFLYFGILQGLVVFVAAFGLAKPHKGESVEIDHPGQKASSHRNFSPVETLRAPVFWVMYVMFVLLAAGGLMAVAQLAPIAKDFKVADVPITAAGLTLPALSFALSLDRLLNGVTRPFFGWISDFIGRENTMFFAFAAEAVGILALNYFGHDPVLFVILSGVVFFAWGEIYSLFPATCADTFGPKFATTNAGLLYTAKGTAALLVPLANLMTEATGSWHMVFVTASIMNAVAAVMALAVLKPMRQRLGYIG